MLKIYILIVISLIHSSFLESSAQNQVLFTIDDNEVTTSEFKYIYEKNNFDGRADYSEKSLREYLDLYIKFKLKIKEAEALGLHNDPKLKDEYDTYVNQLYNSYFDKEITNEIIDEAFARMKHDVSISHIYIEEKSSDKAAKVEIDKVYDLLSKGETFSSVAQKYSDDKFSASNGGYLGYFNTLQIIYPEIEDMAYNIEEGTFSKPFKTKVGYHIIKLHDKRPAVGKIKVAIIKKKNSDTAEEEIVSIYKEIKDGLDFKEAVKKYSEDDMSKRKNGELEWFGIREHNEVFESAAFSLVKNGDISDPIKASNAWYIIKKLDQFRVPPEEDKHRVYQELRNVVMRGEKFKKAKKEFVDNILQQYGYQRIEPKFAAFRSDMLKELKKQEINLIDNQKSDMPILKIADKTFSEEELRTFMLRNATKIPVSKHESRFDKLLDLYVEQKCFLLHRDKLAEQNMEYAALVKEYRDGILLFELMSRRVWKKSEEDSLGLIQFYEVNKEKFIDPANIKVNVTKVNNSQVVAVEKVLGKKKQPSSKKWKAFLKKKGIDSEKTESVVIEEGEDQANLIKWNVGSRSIVKKEDVRYLYEVVDVKEARIKKLEEARGFVISEYQDYLEKKWLEDLRSKYNVVINESVLKSLIKN